MKRLLSVFLLVSMVALAACSSQGAPSGGDSQSGSQPKEQPKEQAGFPTKSITGVIQWGAGGATDNVARAIAPLAEQYLGQSLVMTNKPGATGAVATQYVFDQKADGYTLLFSAENPALYGVLGISQLGFKDFYPVSILGRGVATVVVAADSKYQTLTDVIADAQAQPGKIKMGSTGPGGLPFVVTSMINAVSKTEFNMVPFDGEGPALTALLGGHVDVTIAGLAAAAENAKAGKIRVLAVINNEPVESLPNVPAVTDELPGMEQFLPWGPFYAIFVKEETPDDVKQALVDAFAKANQEEKFQTFLKEMGAVPLGISGAEAEKFWQDFQSTTAWLIEDAGESKVSPEQLGIPRKQ